MFNGRRQPSRGGTSRMMREYQVRICERLGVKLPGPTRQDQPICNDRAVSASRPKATELLHYGNRCFGPSTSSAQSDRLLSVRSQGAYNATMRSSHSVDDVAFSCPHCGARYLVSYTELPIADSGSDYCECCKRRMVQWNSALRPHYKLVERPDRNHL